MASRQQQREWIEEACRAGARKALACQVLGLSVRTVQRGPGDTGGDRRGLAPRTPHNKLSGEQRQAILQVLNTPPYADLAPSQLVPRLADEGRFLASESTLYRLLRGEQQLTHRHAWARQRHARPAPWAATAPNELYEWGYHLLTQPGTRDIFLPLFVPGRVLPQDRGLASL